MFVHTSLGSFVLFTPVGNEWANEYAPFGPKSFRVHPTNSQSMPLPMMGFKYVNSLPPIHYGPFWPNVGIMVHLDANDLLIYPFSFKELTYT